MATAQCPAMPSTSSLLSSLRAFASSSSAFRILHTHRTSTQLIQPRTLYILDASFNPPTLAHLRICLSALKDDAPRRAGPYRLLLLLATQNADKPAKPAAFEHRLSMMGLLAENVRTSLQESKLVQEEIPIDVAVCKPPLFVDKMKAIESSQVYGDDTEQIHLIGFDTLIRLLDPKYYPPDHNLTSLDMLFEKHRVRVTKRVDEDSNDDAQVQYVQRIADGGRESEGGKRQWAEKIELVEGRASGEESISSTKVRKAISEEDDEALMRLVPSNIAEYLQREKPFEQNN